jgi:hypothetical protein
MKKVIHITAVILFITAVLCSCTVQRCPAYSHGQTEQAEQNG